MATKTRGSAGFLLAVREIGHIARRLERDERALRAIARQLETPQVDDRPFWENPGGLELESATLDPRRRALRVDFAAGKTYRLPLSKLELRAAVRSVGLDDVRHGVVLHLRDRSTHDVASDFVLHECEPEYRAAREPRGQPPGIGRNIRRIRQSQGRSARDVAAAAGLAPSNFARLEAGRHEPRLETLARVAEALDVPLADLLKR